MEKWGNIIRILGIAICLIGAYLMAFGEPIIGAEHTGVATVIGIIGISLIGTGTTINLAKMNKEKTIK